MVLVAYDPVLAGIVRICDSYRQTVGTGFVIFYDRERRYGFIATSTQVVELATSYPAEQSSLGKVFVVFQIDSFDTFYEVSTREWLSSTKEDVCILEVRGELPGRVRALPLSLVTTPEGRKVSVFGYPTTTDNFIGEWRYCDICQPGPKQVKTGLFFLQLEAQAITGGYRGAPVWDDARHKVIGMITCVAAQDKQGRSAEAAYAVPVEILQTVYKSVLADNNIYIEIPSPYHGLAPLSEGDATSFFGYEEVTARLVEKLHDMVYGQPRLLAVFGPSGSGKTSVVQAGLIPKIRHGEVDGHTDWGVFITTVSQEPFAQLEAQGLEEASKNLSESLHQWCQRRDCQRLVFILDQFEEFLCNCPYDQQERFVKQLLEVIRESVFTVVLVVKDDFYRLLARHEELIVWVEENLINVFSPKTKEALVSIARKRATLSGALHDHALLEKLYDDVEKYLSQSNEKHPSFIMYYEAYLTQATEQRRDQNIFQENDVNTDTIHVSLDAWAEDIYGKLNEQEQAFVKYVFTQAVLFGDESHGTPDTRRYVWITPLCKEIEEYDLVYRLADKRLLVTDRDKRTGKERVTIAQDALLYEWTRLREWIDEYRQFLSWRQRFQERQEAWVQSNQDNIDKRSEDILLYDFELAEAEMWLAKRPDDVDQQARHFIEASQQRQKQEEQALRETYEQELIRQRSAIEQRYQLTLARHLASQAMLVYDQYPNRLQLSVLLAAESLTRAPSPEAEQILCRGLALLPRPIYCIPSQGNIQAVATAYDGRYIAIASNNEVGIAELPRGHIYTIDAFALNMSTTLFSPDNRFLATVKKDGSVMVYELVTQRRRSWKEQLVTATAFSPDGRYFALANWNGTMSLVKIWDVQYAWRSLSPLSYPCCLRTMKFRSDEGFLVTGYSDGEVRVWDISQGSVNRRQRLDASVNAIDISPGSRYLVIGSESGSIAILDMDTEPISVLLDEKKHASSVRSVVFSPDGRYIATASDDTEVKVFEMPGRSECPPLSHHKPVHTVAFSSDSSYLATASDDNTISIWETDTYHETKRIIHEDRVLHVAFALNSRYLFTASDDQTIRVWDTAKRDLGAQQSPEDLIREVCNHLTRNLTQEEWKQYIGDEPYHKLCDSLP